MNKNIPFLRKLTKDELTNEHSRNLTPVLQEIKETEYDADHENYPYHVYLKDNDIEIKNEGSEICNFLRGKNIFITGATGFLGKVLVEKLLRACPDIGNLYLLVREKKGVTQEARINDMCNEMVFAELSKRNPSFKDKIIIVYGDMREPGLGISDKDRETLRKEANIFYHVAATTRFDEKLKTAVDINLKGTLEIIKLAKECESLNSLIYVGTAYSNCNEDPIEEKIYEPSTSPEELIRLSETLDDDQLLQITPSLLNGAPNTYTLTKKLAEKLIETEAKGLPIAIVRPSIVLSSYKEPCKGWGDNLFGPIGMLTGIAKGFIRCTPVNTNLVADVVPVDYVINACIACSYITAKNFSPNSDDIPVYNMTSYRDNPIKWDQAINCAIDLRLKLGTLQLIWFPTINATASLWLYSIWNIFYHKFPGFILDIGLLLCGQQAQAGKLYKKIDKFVDALTFFTLREFHFNNDNMKKLWNSLNDRDKINFCFDVSLINWREFFIGVALGGQQYIAQETLNSLNEGRKYVRRNVRLVRGILCAFSKNGTCCYGNKVTDNGE